MTDSYVADPRIGGGEMVPDFRTLDEVALRPGPADVSIPFRGEDEIPLPVAEVLKRRRPFRKSKGGEREVKRADAQVARKAAIAAGKIEEAVSALRAACGQGRPVDVHLSAAGMKVLAPRE